MTFFVEFEFRSRLEGVLDGKGEGPAKGGEVEEREGEGKEVDDGENDDDSDDARVEDSRSTNSTNESR